MAQENNRVETMRVIQNEARELFSKKNTDSLMVNFNLFDA